MNRPAAQLVTLLAIGAATFGIAMTVQAKRAEACGCFAPPDPSVPIVQAGERIVFEAKDGIVTAHIQIQYSGSADDFAWLVPIPSVPEIGVGTSELFTQVINATQPRYRVNYSFRGNCPFDPSRNGGFGSPPSDSAGGDGDGNGDGNGEGGVLVIQSAIGPYDFAVLRADDKAEMEQWLADNSYFVPAGTSDVVDPYIREGAFFLALKLRSTEDVGDLQPIVLTYPADKAQVPIILTSVAAERDMGVQIWMVGDSRAIPSNYYHTVINDAKLNWFTSGENYANVVTNAVDEADGHHSFVTEYAGPASVMDGLLMYPGRFGLASDLEGRQDALSYISYLNDNGFRVFNQGSSTVGTVGYTSETLAVLAGHLPVPPQLAADGLTAAEYYSQVWYWLGDYRDNFPEKFTDADLEFDSSLLTMELQERVVEATRSADALFTRNRTLTRMFTTLSPEEMVKDPVFSFNPDLPDVSNQHAAEATYFCGIGGNDDPATTPIVLETEQGAKLRYKNGNGVNPFEGVTMPWALKTQILREEGEPEDVQDNTDGINDALDIFGGGCSVGGNSRGALGGLLLILGAVLFAGRRRRRG